MTLRSSTQSRTLELSMEEAQVLEKVLQRAWEDLRMEVRHTDTREYREALSREREVLQTLLDRLQEDLVMDLKQAT